MSVLAHAPSQALVPQRTPLVSQRPTSSPVLDRLSPREAYEAALAGALLVDIRPELNRELEGTVPGAVVLDRELLRWRLDPLGEARIQRANPGVRTVLICNEGAASAGAAEELAAAGLRHVTDVIGGFRAWRAAGFPVSPASSDLSSPVRRRPARRAPSRPRRH